MAGAGRPRVLFAGHAGSPTGFARVLHSLLPHLAGGWEVHHLGINLPEAAPGCGWTVHPNRGPDVHAESELPALVAALRPDVVVVLDEVWACARHRELLARCGERPRTVLYAAIGGPEDAAPADLRAVAGLDRLVAFTGFGRRLAEAGAARLRAEDPAFVFPPLDVIPHGVDVELFRPLEGGRRQARRLLFPERSDLEESFLVLNANRNQPFKRIDVTVEGFALFARGKPPGVKLYLHMGSRPAPPGTLPLADRLGIRDRLLTTTAGERHPEVSSERLNLIYNACDVGVNTSEKEGWGLVAFEHAATGAAQVVPGQGACAELWRGSALLLPPVGRDSVEGYQRAGRTVTPEGLAEALETLYRDRETLREMSRAAYRNAHRPEYRWAAIAGRWDGLLRALA